MDVDIRLMTENDLEEVRKLRNANSWAYFATQQVSSAQQEAWWEKRDRSVLYFVGKADGLHCWQFSLGADGCLGNLAVADWAKGKGVARDCVRRVLVPGVRYWGLFRTDNPTILRFWPSVGFPEPTDDPPLGMVRGDHAPGSVRWVEHVWPGHPGVAPWFVEQARRLSTCDDHHGHAASRLSDPLQEAAAWLVGCWPPEELPALGIPMPVCEALKLLHRKHNESVLEWTLRIKRLDTTGIAKAVRLAQCEAEPTEMNSFVWHILERT